MRHFVFVLLAATAISGCSWETYQNAEGRTSLRQKYPQARAYIMKTAPIPVTCATTNSARNNTLFGRKSSRKTYAAPTGSNRQTRIVPDNKTNNIVHLI